MQSQPCKNDDWREIWHQLKIDAVQIECFVQSAVKKKDISRKSDTYAKLTLCKNNSPCKSDV